MAAGNTYTPIATTTLTSTAADVTFNSISGSYTDLIVVVQGKLDSTGDLRFRINSDTGSNYSATRLTGDGTSAASGRLTSATSGVGDYNGQIDTTLGNNTIILQFMNYSNSTTYKTILARANNAGLGVDAIVNLWRNTNAITSLTFAKNSTMSGTWQIGSTFTLYGITEA